MTALIDRWWSIERLPDPSMPAWRRLYGSDAHATLGSILSSAYRAVAAHMHSITLRYDMDPTTPACGIMFGAAGTDVDVLEAAGLVVGAALDVRPLDPRSIDASKPNEARSHMVRSQGTNGLLLATDDPITDRAMTVVRLLQCLPRQTRIDVVVGLAQFRSFDHGNDRTLEEEFRQGQFGVTVTASSSSAIAAKLAILEFAADTGCASCTSVSPQEATSMFGWNGVASFLALPVADAPLSVPGIRAESLELHRRSPYRPGTKPSPPLAPQDSDAIRLGHDLIRRESVTISPADLTKHALITGATGSGKSTTVRRVVTELMRLNVPVVLLEPAKDEHRSIPGASLHTPGRDLRLDPCFNAEPDAIKRSSYILSTLESAMELEASMLGLLTEAVRGFCNVSMFQEARNAFAKYGESSCRIMIHHLPRPTQTLSELLKRLQDDATRSSFSDELKGNYRAMFQHRMAPILEAAGGSIWHPDPRGDAIADLLKPGAHVVRMVEVDGPALSAFAMVLLISLRRLLEGRKAATPSPDLRAVLVLEEAHNLMPAPVANPGSDSRYSSSRVSDHFTKALREVRALGLGLIVVDQSPVALAPDAVRNTGTRICHRVADGEGAECLAKAMAYPAAASELVSLVPGQALLATQQTLVPRLVHMDSEEETQE